jgi:ribosome-associated protein
MAIADALDQGKGRDIRVLDVSEVSGFTDYFVIASGSSTRHVRALADKAREAAERVVTGPVRVEGLEACRWVLIDALDVVVHVFVEEAREFYGLERLWGEAAPVAVPLAAAAR